MKFRLKVKEIAQAKGYSMGRLSRRADLDKVAVKRLYDDPSYNPSLLTMLRIAKALHVRLGDLVEVLPDDEEEIEEAGEWQP
jgi:DNA-binding Xre family transcriptional regulator